MTQIAAGTESARIADERRRWVARGVATTPLVVARAEGARIEDVDGRSYIDFAGGIGCQNLGHGMPAAVAAIHEQADRYLHQCFMVGLYEPYVEVCRRLGELSPCAGGDQKSLLVNSGAEAVENAVKIARAATGRPAVIVFDNAFHGRTLLTMTMTAKLVVQAGLRPVRARGLPRARAVPVPRHLDRRGASGLELLFKRELDPETVACVVLEPVQGEGGFVPMPHDYPGRAARGLPRARDPLRRRRGADRRGAHRAASGRSSTTTSSPTCSSRASRSAAGCRSRRSRARRADRRRGRARRPRRDVRRQPGGLRGGAAVLDEVASRRVPRARAGARRAG